MWLSSDKKQVVTPGWREPNIANLTLGPKDQWHIGDSAFLSIAGRLDICQQELNQPWSVHPMPSLHPFPSGHSCAHSTNWPRTEAEWMMPTEQFIHALLFIASSIVDALVSVNCDMKTLTVHAHTATICPSTGLYSRLPMIGFPVLLLPGQLPVQPLSYSGSW